MSTSTSLITSSKKKDVKRSHVWNYFEEINEEGKKYTKCQIEGCKEKLSYNGNTSTMATHMKAKHPSISLQTDQDQPTLNSEQFKLKSLSNEKKNQITKSICDFITLDMRSLSIIDGVGFQNLIHVLEPRYEIPSRTSFSRTLIPESFNQIKTLLIEELKEIKAYATTFDYWTSNACRSYLTITIHYLTKGFKLQDFILSTCEITDPHTGINTAQNIGLILTEYGLPTHNPHLMWSTCDGAANMKKTTNILGHTYIYCFAHLLHNTLLKSKWIQEQEISEVMFKSRELIKYFKNSTKNTNKLNEMNKKMNLKQKKLKLDVITRWHSTYDMLQRLVENRTTIVNLALEDKEVQNLNLNESEWQDLINVKNVLSPFRDISDLLCSVQTPSISILKPIITNIKNNLLQVQEDDDVLISQMKSQIYDDFCQRTNIYSEIDDLLNLATLLDPRVKNLVISDVQQKEKAYSLLYSSCEIYGIDIEPIENSEELIEKDLEFVKKK